MEAPYLVPVSEDDCADRGIFDMLQDIDRCENGFENAAFGLSFGEYVEFVRGRMRYRHGLDLPEGRVPETWFWMRDGDRVVGYSKLRHRLNEALRKHGGHIGYGIRKSLRGMGYGTEILRLTLLEAAKLDLKEVLLTCDEANLVSRKVIERNGGRLADVLDGRMIFIIGI